MCGLAIGKLDRMIVVFYIVFLVWTDSPVRIRWMGRVVLDFMMLEQFKLFRDVFPLDL